MVNKVLNERKIVITKKRGEEPMVLTMFSAGLSDKGVDCKVQGQTEPSGISRPQLGQIIGKTLLVFLPRQS